MFATMAHAGHMVPRESRKRAQSQPTGSGGWMHKYTGFGDYFLAASVITIENYPLIFQDKRYE